MNNTIANVPRELLADLLGNDHDKRIMAERHLLAMLANAPSPANHVEDVRAMVAAPSPAGVDGLEVRAYEDSGGALYMAKLLEIMAVDSVGCEPLCRLSDAEAIIDGLRGEVADLHTTMMAAAVEIQEHWAAHCDEEGYGPANLMHRLERGIASQYGYSAETLVRLESQRDQQAQRIGELEGLLREARLMTFVVNSGQSGVLRGQIDAALSAGKEGE